MSTFNAAGWYDKEKFSDITICFSDRKVECHKIILSESSKYFETILSPDSRFAEANKNEIVLKDDDPDALEALLRWSYGIKYNDSSIDKEKQNHWSFHLELYQIARKYQIPKLEKEALANFKTLATRTLRTDEIWKIICKVLTSADGEIVDIAEQLKVRHVGKLVDHPGFLKKMYEDRSLIELCLGGLSKVRIDKLFEDPKFREALPRDLIWQHFDRYHSFSAGLVEIESVQCAGTHRHVQYRNIGTLFVTCWCGSTVRRETIRSLWVKRCADGKVLMPSSH